MAKVISFFNHKGGVGKTTLIYNLAWKLANSNKRVLLIDADPQQNLTSFIHGFSDTLDYTLFTKTIKDLENCISIYEYFAPKLFQSVIENNKPLYKKEHSSLKKPITLLRGDILLSSFDVEFSYAIQGNSLTASHLPVAFNNAIQNFGNDYDFILIDMSPNLGMLNMFTLMSSDYFIIPVNPSFFCLQALDNLQSVINDWDSKIDKYRINQFNKIGIQANPKFLGIVSQNFRPRQSNGDGVVASFSEWEKRINVSALSLYEKLDKLKMTVSREDFINYFPNSEPFLIDKIPDLNQLKTVSEEYGLPIFALSTTDLTKEGLNQSHYNTQIANLEKALQKIADGIMKIL